jgi:DNA-binding MarR family transcriptional regulator
VTEIARGLKTTKAMISTNIRRLEKKGLVELEKKGPLKFYRLSEKGEALTWALVDLYEKNPDVLTALYEAEETARNIGVRVPPSLSVFFNQVESLTEAEENLLIQCAQVKANKSECSRRFLELRKMREDLSRKFEETRGSLIKEIQAGGVPYAAFSRLESLDDLIFLQPLISFSNSERKIEELAKVVSDLRRELNNAKKAIAGLQKMRDEGIMTEEEFSDRKDLYEGKIQKIQQLLEKKEKA